MSDTIFKTATGEWEVVIGLEIHAQVVSSAKLFSGAPVSFAAEPNECVSPIDAGMPGMLPVLNEFCVEQSVKTGLGLGAQINFVSRFDRKNYFYPDLPSGYQISQFYQPIVGEGYLDIDLENGEQKRIRIERIHLEQDAGKSIHDLSPTASFIDLNRAGTALMEIVTMPDLRSAEEVMAFVKKMRQLLRYMGTSDGNMEEGSMRADVNVSVRRPGGPLGTRAEIKNVNSIRFIGQAVAYEVGRQIDIIESGGAIKQETRLYDPGAGETRSMRSKEDAEDYRYFPDPDLLPIVLTPAYVDRIRESLPELPDQKRSRFMEVYALPFYDATVITTDIETADFYEKAVLQTSAWAKDRQDQAVSRMVANWFTGDFFALLKKDGKDIASSPLPPEALAQLVDLIQGNVISGRIAKDVFQIMWETGDKPLKIVEDRGLVQITDTSSLEAVIEKVLNQNQNMVQEYKAGKDKLFGFFVGCVMKETQGKANPSLVNDLLKAKLASH